MAFANPRFCLPKILDRLRVVPRTTATREQIERLIDGVLTRYHELGMTDEKFAAAGGPSTTTMTAVRSRALSTPTSKTLDRFDAGLRWQPGSAHRLLWLGETPMPIGSGGAGRGEVVLSGQDRDRLVDLLRSVGKSMDEAVKILGG